MLSILSLWLPIVVSATGVFIVSSIIHMVLKYHANDYTKVPSEDEVMDALRPFNIPPGDYFMPQAKDMKEMSSPEYIEKTKIGPNVLMTVVETGPMKMGKSLVLWFINILIVSFIAAYVASRALGNISEIEYLQVFRFVGVTAFMGYSMALLSNSIWYKKSWSSTFKSMFDGLIYALVTAGFFGWLWPYA